MGFFNCMIDSFRLALGDASITEYFVDNTEYIACFWFLFILGSLFETLIILNMVIALIWGTFDRVNANMVGDIRRAKIGLVCDNYHSFSSSLKAKFNTNKYLLAIEVDPEVDSVEKDSMEKRLNDRISKLESDLSKVNANSDAQQDRLSHISYTLDNLVDRLVPGNNRS